MGRRLKGRSKPAIRGAQLTAPFYTLPVTLRQSRKQSPLSLTSSAGNWESSLCQLLKGGLPPGSVLGSTAEAAAGRH